MSEEAQSITTTEFQHEEERVEEQSKALKKELGLGSLVLTQILFIVGLTWVGVAGKLGPPHVVFWLLAIILFYIPSAVVVIYLNRLMPLEGGLYQWAKLGFSDFLGFMVAWNLWLYVIVNSSELGLLVGTFMHYALGERAAWMADSKWFAVVCDVAIVTLMVLVSILGLGIGKWIYNAGALIMLVIFATLIILPVIHVATGSVPHYNPFSTALPAITLLNLNILGKMGFGALGGFEYIAILAGETKSPARTIGRSVVIAAPIVALMFILGTSSVLAFISPDQIDLIGPIPQVLSVGFKNFGAVALIVSGAILLTLILRLAQASVVFTPVTRLPMVAGWDRLLPEWFSRLNAKYRTPVNSIFVVGALALGLGLLSLLGVGQQEAFQTLFNSSGILYALTYLVMFAIPIFGLRDIEPHPSFLLKLAAVSGFLMTLLFVTLSVFPIIEVASRTAFTLKVIAVIVISNAVGAALFMFAERRRRDRLEEAASAAAG
ncbi:MAG TPA: APC family permease [Pyrinomonadaceae bacterium]|nr:APC family permease [Pyrinomonadaceae bacterium]